MTRLEKCVDMLSTRGISAKIENDSVYVVIDWTELELSEYEINWQANEYDILEQEGEL